MMIKRFTAPFAPSIIGVLVLMSPWTSLASAQDGHAHKAASQHHEPAPEATSNAGALVKIVRESTERFRNLSVAEA